MKNAWIKFKHWLIKKLGGETHSIEFRYVNPTAVVVKRHIGFEFLKGEDEVYKEHLVIKDLVQELGQELLDRNLVDIVTEDDPIYWQRHYKAVVMVYAEKGADDERN